MKFLTLIIVLVFGKVAHSQLVTEHYVGPYVQSYLVLNKGDVVNCYTDISFSSVDSIVIDKEKEVIIVFTISESKNGLLKIKDARTIMDTDSTLNSRFIVFREKWMKSSDSLVIDNTNYVEESSIDFYSKASKDSKIVITTNQFFAVTLIATDKSWAKVRFTLDNQEYVCWMHEYDQCAMPWTACNY